MDREDARLHEDVMRHAEEFRALAETALTQGHASEADACMRGMETAIRISRALRQPTHPPDVYEALREVLPDIWLPLAATLDEEWEDYGPDTQFSIDIGAGAPFYFQGSPHGLVTAVKTGHTILVSPTAGRLFEPRRIYLAFTRLGAIGLMDPDELPLP